MTRRQFEGLVERAMRKLPRKFRERIANIAVVVEDWADEETLAEMAEIVRETVVHELGHYFGLDDDTMHQIEEGGD